MSLKQLNFSIFVVAQSMILKSVYFKNLMQAFYHVFFLDFSIFWVVDQVILVLFGCAS